MVAQDVKYHKRCLTALYNRYRALKDTPKDGEHSSEVLHGIALAELISYIDEAQDCEVSPVFRLADLTKLYISRLEQLGVQNIGKVHSTRMKERLLAHLPGLRAHKEGRNVLLAFDTDIGIALRKACEKDCDDEGMCLTAAANVVRRDIFQQQSTFTGSYQNDCQVKSIPQSLVSSVSMILNGPSIECKTDSQVVLTIAQLLQYNIRSSSSVRRQPVSKKS